MSTKKPSTKQKTSVTTTAAKRPVGRPRKTAAPKRADKARIVAVKTVERRPTNLAATGPMVVGSPKSVQKFAAAKAQKPAPTIPLGRPVKLAVNIAQLERSLKEAVEARAAKEKLVHELEAALQKERAEKWMLQRTVDHLKQVIDELKAKDEKRGWLRRLFGGKA